MAAGAIPVPLASPPAPTKKIIATTQKKRRAHIDRFRPPWSLFPTLTCPHSRP